MIANCDHLKKLKFSKALPFAFTERGAIMAAAVLNSPRAVDVSVFIVRAFVRNEPNKGRQLDIQKLNAEIAGNIARQNELHAAINEIVADIEREKQHE